MPKRLRLTRRFPAAMTEDGYRSLRRLAEQNNLEEGMVLSFVFENFGSIIDQDTFGQRLRLFKADVEAQKK